MTLPVAILAPVAATAYLIAKDSGKNPQEAMYVLTGVNAGKFSGSRLVQTYGPIAAGFAIHWAAGRFGVNRALGRAKVPLLRI